MPAQGVAVEGVQCRGRPVCSAARGHRERDSLRVVYVCVSSCVSYYFSRYSYHRYYYYYYYDYYYYYYCHQCCGSSHLWNFRKKLEIDLLNHRYQPGFVFYLPVKLQRPRLNQILEKLSCFVNDMNFLRKERLHRFP